MTGESEGSIIVGWCCLFIYFKMEIGMMLICAGIGVNGMCVVGDLPAITYKKWKN